jgi:putative SOS response-associated peptidase YedK
VIRARNEPPEIYPNYMAPVVRLTDGERTIEPMRWGFPPPPFTTSKAPSQRTHIAPNVLRNARKV